MGMKRTRARSADAAVVRTAIALALTVFGCSEDQPRPNVLLIVVDTLRADHLGTYGYPLDTSPNIDAFASEALKFNYAISAAPWTSPSIASLFTGFYPTAHGVVQHVHHRRMPDDAISADLVTLAEVFQDAGYATSGITANAWVSDQRGYSQGFDQFETIDYARAPDVNQLAYQVLERAQASEPFFLYVHYMDPHPPMRSPRNLTSRFAKLHRTLSPDHPVLSKMVGSVAAYDAAIFYLDGFIGALFEHLKNGGVYADTVIAFVSDHGFPFQEHGEKSHGFKLHNEDTHVPLILKLPGRTGEVDQTVSTIDLFPTLVQVAGLEPIEGIQGVSLLDGLAERRARGAFSENTVRTRNHRSLTTHDARKLILAFDKGAHEVVSRADEKEVVGLFDSRSDYFETKSLNDPSEIAALRERLWSIYEESVQKSRKLSPVRVELDGKTVEELKRLGYVE
jgi:arylsulfatase